MRIGFDAHMIGQQETGNETYALGLLQGLHRIGVTVDAYGSRPWPPFQHRYHRTWPQQSMARIPITTPILAARDRLDVYHATYVLPPLLPCAGVVTIHDITYALHPEWFSPRVRRMLSSLVPMSIHRARHVIAISERTKQDIVERYQVAPDRITVTYLAPRPAFSVPEPASSSSEPFFLFVGNVEPRKNVPTLIRAVRLLRERSIEVPLIIAGKPGLGHEAVAGLVRSLGLEDMVRFLGYVPDAKLRHLYATCTALVHPALYEGFGLTPLEAMAQGAAVITSNTSSLPEVIGEAGLLVDPSAPEAWANAMERVLDSSLRHHLRQLGRARSQLFSWERCASTTLDVYCRTLQREPTIH